MLGIVFVISFIGLCAAFLFARFVLKADQGSAKKQEIALAIRQGAEAFLKRQYSAIGIISLLVVIILFALYSRSGDFGSGRFYWDDHVGEGEYPYCRGNT